jgi:hypothetical protein
MPQYDAVQAGEKMERVASGAIRSTNDGKGRFDLISVHGLLRLAMHYQHGAEKYCDRNWEKSMPMSRYVNSAMRHLVKYLGGDRCEDHLAAVAWNVFALMDHEERIERGLISPDVNDLPKPNTMFKPDEFVECKQPGPRVDLDRSIDIDAAIRSLRQQVDRSATVFNGPDFTGTKWDPKLLTEKNFRDLSQKFNEAQKTQPLTTSGYITPANKSRACEAFGCEDAGDSHSPAF